MSKDRRGGGRGNDELLMEEMTPDEKKGLLLLVLLELAVLLLLLEAVNPFSELAEVTLCVVECAESFGFSDDVLLVVVATDINAVDAKVMDGEQVKKVKN